MLQTEPSAGRELSQHAPPGWWSTAMSGPVVRRALGYLVVVGAVLVLINHGDALWRGEMDAGRLFKIVLTPLVPYCVSTLSSVSAIRSAVSGASSLPSGS